MMERLRDFFSRKRKKKNIGFSLYSSEYLANICQPKTVIDVGVGYGTHVLYTSFSKAYFLLIEPIQEYKDAIDKILEKYRGEAHFKAVGDKRKTVLMNVDKKIFN